MRHKGSSGKPLSALLVDVPGAQVFGPSDVTVQGVTSDSRQVTPGACFVAIRGVHVDAHRFIPEAIAAGARVVVGERPPQSEWLTRVTYVQVPHSRDALARLAAAWYEHPSRQLLVVGVTGTDGKTTTSTLIAGVLEAAGLSTGLITTTGARISDRVLDTGFHVTTPDALQVHALLRQMVDAGLKAAVVESTSHGLDQRRVDAVAFDVAVVTNVTHEHLDYHGSWEQYMAAKARLFSLTAARPPKDRFPTLAILNRDDRSYPYLKDIPVDVKLTYGVDPSAQVRPLHVDATPQGLTIEVETPRGKLQVRSALLGYFNVYNILAAVAVGIGLHLPFTAIAEGIARVRHIEGRMEPVDEGQDFLALVDFAHSPVALERALHTLRELTPGRIIAVFGSAGLRDVAKRYLMGRIGVQLADVVVLTAEDPRTESLDAILAEMARGAREGGGIEGQTFWRIPDRQQAILFAVQMAQAGDTVAVFGKGHERSMCFGTVEHPWYDRDALRWALRVRLHGEEIAGPPPFQLPTWKTPFEASEQPN